MNHNLLVYCDSAGAIEIMLFKTAEESIRSAKITIQEMAKCTSISLIGLRIYFADGTTAVWNSQQKSDCLRISAPPVIVDEG
jgi:hypothetical protein